MSRTRWPRVLWIVGAVLLVAMVFHVVALAVSGGPLTGPVSLRKPATFAETGWLVSWSVALLMPVLRMRTWQEHVIGFATALFAVGETTIMAIEAWRGVPSHYNFATPFDATLMRGFAAGTAGVFLIATIVLLVAALRARISPDVRIGTVGGVAVLLLGCAIGFGMISNNSGVYQGSFGGGFANRGSAYLGPTPATIGQEYLLIRPETRGGDLVLPHAIGVHGLVLLAVPAVLLAGTALDARRRLIVVAAVVGAVVVAEGVLVVHALRELPLDQLSPLALIALGLCGGVLLAGYAITAAALLAARRVSRGRGRASRPVRRP